jgi:hypothetical protein
VAARELALPVGLERLLRRGKKAPTGLVTRFSINPDPSTP